MVYTDYLRAFFVGGMRCVIGQLLIDFTKLTPARILVAYVVAGTILTVLGLYQPLVDFAGCGATIPLTGFGYSLGKGVIEGVEKNTFLGIFSGGLSNTSAGITAAILFGFIIALIFKPKEKK